MKAFWIVIAILGVVLIAVLFWNNKSKSPEGTAALAGSGATGTDPLVNAITGMLAPTAATAGDCRSDCDKLCGTKKITDGRWQCERDCRSACIAGKPYKTMFP